MKGNVSVVHLVGKECKKGKQAIFGKKLFLKLKFFIEQKRNLQSRLIVIITEKSVMSSSAVKYTLFQYMLRNTHFYPKKVSILILTVNC